MDISFVRLFENRGRAMKLGASFLVVAVVLTSVLPFMRSTLPNWLAIAFDFTGTILTFLGILCTLHGIQAWRKETSPKADFNKPRETTKTGVLGILAAAATFGATILLRAGLPGGLSNALTTITTALFAVGVLYLVTGFFAKHN